MISRLRAHICKHHSKALQPFCSTWTPLAFEFKPLKLFVLENQEIHHWDISICNKTSFPLLNWKSKIMALERFSSGQIRSCEVTSNATLVHHTPQSQPKRKDLAEGTVPTGEASLGSSEVGFGEALCRCLMTPYRQCQLSKCKGNACPSESTCNLTESRRTCRTFGPQDVAPTWSYVLTPPWSQRSWHMNEQKHHTRIQHTLFLMFFLSEIGLQGK